MAAGVSDRGHALMVRHTASQHETTAVIATGAEPGASPDRETHDQFGSLVETPQVERPALLTNLVGE